MEWHNVIYSKWSWTGDHIGHKHLRISSANDEVRHGTNSFDSIGFDLTDDYALAHGTTKLVLQYDYDSNKLKLWDVTYDIWYLIATASVAEDGNPVTISTSVGDGGSVPNFSDREQTYNIIAQTTAAADTTWRDGLLAGTVATHNTGITSR